MGEMCVQFCIAMSVLRVGMYAVISNVLHTTVINHHNSLLGDNQLYQQHQPETYRCCTAARFVMAIMC